MNLAEEQFRLGKEAQDRRLAYETAALTGILASFRFGGPAEYFLTAKEVAREVSAYADAMMEHPIINRSDES